MFVLRRLGIFQPGQFIGQVGRFVDEHRQALRADEIFSALVVQLNERDLLFGFLTVQASLHFSPIVNRKSQIPFGYDVVNYIVPLYIPPSTVSITPVM
jgi:hypothetical protein